MRRVTSENNGSDDEVRYEVADHVATLTLDAPQRMNTISAGMLRQISVLLLRADRDPEVRCVVLTGEGRAFSSPVDRTTACGADYGNSPMWC